MTDTQNYQDLIGTTAVDSDGDKIGKIGGVYFDDHTGEPVWITVSTGLFGTKESVAPLYGSHHDGENLRLAVDKATVKDAPNVDADGHLEDAENDALYEYYGNASGHVRPAAPGTQGPEGRDFQQGAAPSAPQFEAQGHDTSGPNTDDAMTRSEEQVHVGTEQVETGRARLRKYVVTEDVTQTVPVSHEELRIEREPITESNVGDATSGAAISEEEHEVTLHAERPVVSKETVPVERVRLGTETVAGEQTVTEQVRKEQIDEPTADGDPAAR